MSSFQSTYRLQPEDVSISIREVSYFRGTREVSLKVPLRPMQSFISRGDTTHPLLQLLPQFLLQAGHLLCVLTGRREETQLQLLRLSHHLTEQLIVGEDRCAGQRAVMLNTLPTHRKLGRNDKQQGSNYQLTTNALALAPVRVTGHSMSYAKHTHHICYHCVGQWHLVADSLGNITIA